jgi:hypothetical protein
LGLGLVNELFLRPFKVFERLRLFYCTKAGQL